MHSGHSTTKLNITIPGPHNGPIPAGNRFLRVAFFQHATFLAQGGEVMTRETMLAIALGGLVIAGTPFAANAQSGDALAHAERACSVNGVRPYSNAYNTCVDRVADDFDRGAPQIAYNNAEVMGSANRVCMSYGLDTRTLGYRQCVDNELSRRGAITDVVYVPTDVPHVAVSHDPYGYGYDRDGNLLDPSGYVIRPVPLSQ